MSRKKLHIYAMLCVAIMASWACSNGRWLSGGDRDCHGCINSAGYSWSELLQECIQPFKTGIELSPVETGTVTYAVYLIFNENGSKVEIFLPEEGPNPILTREFSGPDESVWKSPEEGTPVLKKTGNSYLLLLDGQPAYRN